MQSFACSATCSIATIGSKELGSKFPINSTAKKIGDQAGVLMLVAWGKKQKSEAFLNLSPIPDHEIVYHKEKNIRRINVWIRG